MHLDTSMAAVWPGAACAALNAGRDSPPWLMDGFQMLVGFSRWVAGACRGGGLEDGVTLPPSVLQSLVMGCLQGTEGMQM